jgi:hypothetical protein
VASIERTAYPRFKRAVSDRELLEPFTPGLAEIEWMRELTRSPEHCLALAGLPVVSSVKTTDYLVTASRS